MIMKVTMHYNLRIRGSTVPVLRIYFITSLYCSLFYDQCPVSLTEVIGPWNHIIPECSILNGSADGRCYRMFKSSVAVTWMEAQSGCENEGGSLIIIRDAIQQKLIHRWLIQRVILDYEQNLYIGEILEETFNKRRHLVL